jgi:hypothetical protein
MFDQTYELGDMWVWNSRWAQEGKSGFKETIIYYNDLYNEEQQLMGPGTDGAWEFGIANPTDYDEDTPHQTVIPFGGIKVRGVRLQQVTAWGPDGGGLEEVRFNLFGTGTAPTETFTWARANGGDWDVAGHWSPAGGGPPNGNRDAIFAGSISGPSTVYTDSSITLRSVRFDNHLSYAVSGLGSVNLADGTDASGTVPARVDVWQGTHQFQVQVNLLDDTTADAWGNSTLNFNNQINTNGNTLTLTGMGVVNLNHSVTGGGAVSGSGTLGTASNTSLGGDLTSTGTLAIEIRGTGEGSGSVPTDFSRFDVSGAANLDGAVDISLVDFTPTAGTNFTILTTTNGINFVGGSTGIGDLNLTGNSTDFSLALGNGGNDLVLSYLATGGVAGDFNGSGIVDAADYTIFRDNLGGDSSVLNGNGSGAATVVQADYDLWKANFGNGGSSSAAVPEPATLTLFLLAALTGVVRTRCR